jgi:hypothetical protein
MIIKEVETGLGKRQTVTLLYKEVTFACDFAYFWCISSYVMSDGSHIFPLTRILFSVKVVTRLLRF